MTPDPYENLDAAYLLDALTPSERDDFEVHLSGCSECRARVNELRPLLPLLASADERILDDGLNEAPRTPFPETMLPELITSARRARRRRRALVTALAGLAAAGAAGLVLTLTTPWTSTPTPGQQMTELRPSIVSAAAAIHSTDWGTEITLTCWYRDGAVAPAGYSYALTVRGADGRTQQLGSWRLSPGQKLSFTAATALDVNQIRAVDITDGNGTALLELVN